MSTHPKTFFDRARALLTRVGGLWIRYWRIPVAIGAFLVVLLIVAGPVTLAAPQVCGACHGTSGEYSEWRKSSHANVGCQDCHVDRELLGGVGNTLKLTTETWRWFAQRSHTASDTARNTAWVPDSACRKCHPEIGSEPTFTSRGLKMSHEGLAKGGITCVQCHGEIAHSYHEDRISQPTMSMCARCHNNVEVSGKCDLCHVGNVTVADGRRRDVEMAKTHGQQWRSLHGMGDLDTCTLCHQTSKCTKCHGTAMPHGKGFGATHGKEASKLASRCMECHTQAYCDSCHGIDMPHPLGFLAKHSKVATAINDPRCERCHPPANCNECHEDHIHPPGGLLLPSEKSTGDKTTGGQPKTPAPGGDMGGNTATEASDTP